MLAARWLPPALCAILVVLITDLAPVCATDRSPLETREEWATKAEALVGELLAISHDIAKTEQEAKAITRRGDVTGKQQDMMVELVVLNLQSYGIHEKADGLLWKLWLTTGKAPAPKEENELLSANLSRNAREYQEYVNTHATTTEAELVRLGLTNAVDSLGSPLWYPTMKYLTAKTGMQFEWIISIHVSPPHYIIEAPLRPDSYQRLSSALSAWLDANKERMVWHPNARRYGPDNRKYVGVAELSRELRLATDE